MTQGHNVEQEPRDTQGRWTKVGVVSVNLSPEIRAVLDSLRASGGHPFIVGGSVRDAALGHVVKDTDIEVGGLTHEQVVRALSKHGVVDQVGKSFGVYKVRLSNGEDLDISLPRRERKTAEGHKGFAVEPDPFMSPQEAAARRDFTINSLMYDPHTGTVHDYHGGLADLKNKRLRHVGPAFGEDPLRVLRAMQFAARFGFDLDPHTAQVAQGLKKEYTTIAKERIWTEWEKVAQKAKQPSKAIDVLRATGWIDFYPELKALDGVPQEPDWHPEGGVLTHTKHVMDEAARIADRDHLKGDQRTILILAALCHDFGKAIPGITQVTEKNGVQRITSYGHDDAGVDPSRSFLERIGCPLSLRQSILTLVKEHMAHTGVQANHRTVTRLAHRLDPVTVRDWERIVEADHSGRPPLPKSRPAKGWLDIAETLGASKGKVKPLIGGDMLIARGLKPGPQFKGILNAAYDAQMDKEVTAENAAGWLDRYLAEHGFVSSMKNKSQQPLLFLAKAEHDVSDEPRDKDGKWTKEPGSGIPTAAERAAYAKRVAENPQPGDTVFVGDKTMADYGDIYEVTKGAHENGLQNNLIKIRKSYWAEGKEASASLGVWQKYIKDGNLIPRMPSDVAPDPSPEMLKEIRKDCATKEVQQIKDWAYSGYMPSQVLEKTLNVLCLKPPKDFSFTLKAAVPGVSQLSTGKEWTVTEGPKTTSLKSKVTLTAKDGEKVTLSVKDWVKTARSGEVPFTVKQVTDLLPTKCQECGKEIQGKDIHTCPFCSNEYCAADIAKHEETCSEKAVCAKCGKVMKKTDAVKCPYCGKTFCVEHASADDHDCPSTVACSVCGHKTYYKYMTKDPTTGKVYCQHDAEQVLGAADFDGDGVLGVSDIVSNNELARKTKDRLVRTILARLKDNPDFDDFLKDRKRLRYVLPGTAMATGQSEAYEAVNSLIKSWAVTSCDNNRLAIALQKAAIKEFNLSDNVVERPWESRTLYDASSSVPVEVRQKAIDDSEPAMRAFLRAMYDNTQEYFARKGVKNVTLYRGFSYDTKGLEELRGTLTGGMSKPIAAEAKLQPMSSFSTDVQTADTFSGDRGLAVVMETKDVPVEDVLSTAMTGFGCLNEQEMVVLGNSLKPCLVGPISAWRNKQTKQSNGKKFWYDVLPKNEDVLVAKSERRRPLQISVDRDIQNADWTKQSWDLPTYKSKGFWRSLKTSGMDLAHFRTLPVFKHLFRRHGVTKSQQPLLLLTKAHDVSKEPRDKQGKWAKVNGLPDDVQIDPGDMALHELLHGEHFDLAATSRKNDLYGDNDFVLSVKPRLDKRYHREIPGSFEGDPPKGWYDTRLAHIEDGKGDDLYQPHYVRLNANLPAEYSQDLPAKPEKGHVWRGLSWEEMQAIKKSGAICSHGQYNIGDAQKGLTYFADDPGMAESYAGNFAPPASIPTFDRPSYLIKVPDPGETGAVRLPHIPGEVGLKGLVPASKIEEIYEMQPFSVDAGEYELRTDHGLPKPTFSSGSSTKPGADYVFRKVTDVPGFLQGKEGKMMKSFDPNQPRDEKGRWTKLAQGELAGMAADAKKYKDFQDYSRDWSVMGMRGQYWHLTNRQNFKIDPDYRPNDYASNGDLGGDGTAGLQVSSDPEWWHQQLPKGRRWAAEIDLSHAKRNQDYHVINRGFGSEVFINNAAAVSVKRVVPYKQAVQEAQHYTEIGPQSEEELRDFWTTVNKTTVPAAKSHQSLMLLSKSSSLPEVGDEVRIRNFRHPLSPYPLIVHGVGNDGNVQVRRLDTPKGALVSVPLKHLLLTRRAVHRKNDKPQPSSGFPNPYAAMAGYLDTTKSHDVSQEPRDEKGRWTAVGRLVYHLQQNKSPELHELVDNVHWGLGPSGVMPAKARRTYIDYTQDGLLAARETGYSRNQDAYYKTKDVIQKLDEQDQDTLERLIRGDIPAEWGHDPAYIDHLKKWGNGSKLLDDEGVPYRLYHGTPSVFRAFDPTKRGSSTHMSDAKKAFFFTGSPEDAGFFSFFPVMQKYDDFQSVREGKNPAESGTPNVMPVHVRLRKPLVLVDESGAMDMELLNGALDLAHRKGYDGIVMYVGVSPIEDHLKFVREDALPFKKVGSVKATGMSTSIYDPGNAILPRQSNMVVCAFNPVDVKSALGDNGNFDESSDLGKSHELLLLSKSGHDVSTESRDQRGRWVHGERPAISRAKSRANFKNWFGQSVITKTGKPGGKPLVVYHGTAASFSTFRPSRGSFGVGIYFANDPQDANSYAEMKEGSQNVIPVYLRIVNPLVLPASPSGWPQEYYGMWGNDAYKLTDLAQQQGHDGIIVRGAGNDGGDYYVVFQPQNIKSAFGNDGSYSTSGDIGKSHDVSGEPRDKNGEWTKVEGFDSFKRQNQQEIPVLDKAFQGWAASLTPGQRAAIKLYTQPKVYKKLNNALRSPKNQGKPLKEYLNENDFRIAALFSKAIQQGHLPKDMTLFRGLDGDFAQTLASAKPGDVVSDSAFLSTSINPLWAQSFAEGPQGVIVQIHAPQGTPAAYINAVDLSSQEHELTLPRKTKLRVIAKKVWEYSPYAWSADKPRKYTIVEAKVLPQEVVKSHDVFGEPRDEKGRWTAGRWAQQAREHGMSEKAYIQAANENLKRIIKPARTWIGISPEHLSGVLDAGKYSSRLDDSLGLEDDESAAWVNETRERIERHFFGSPNVNPVYGFLSMDPTEGLTTDRDQPGDNYGSAFIKLKPEVAKRSGIFVGDSGTTYMPPTDGFGEPLEDEDPPEIDAELSPLTNPSIHSVPKEGGIDPLKIKKLSDIQPYVEVLVRPEGNRPAVSLSDIEEVVFTDKPDQGIVTKLHAKGIPFRVFERPQGERSRVPTNEHEAIDFAVKNPFRAVFGKVNPESTEPKLQRAKKMNMRLMAYSSSTGSTTMSKMDSITFGEPGYTQATLTMQELEQFVRNGDIPVMTKETIENAQNSGYLFNPWWQGGTVKSTPQGSPLVLTKSAHDVSNEPRDKDGRWTAVARLDSNLKRKRLGSLDTLVRTLIDDTNSSRLGPQGYLYNIAGVSESDYDPEVPYTSSPDTIATVRQLDPQDRDTLRRLVYGDIPVSRGHDAVYLAHLKHWAEGSKLVDEGGLPYRVFHGSDAKFRAFSIKKRGNATHYQDAKKAFFFTANPTDASRFATLAYRSRKNPGNDRAPQVYATYVRLKKPLVVLDGSGAISAVVMRQALDYATNHGYDGVVMYEQDRPEELFSAAALDRVETVYDYRGRASSMYSTGGTLPRGGDMVIAVIAPADIKSATGNRGTFSESSDIGKSQGLLLLGKSGHDVADEPRNRQGEWTKVAHDNHHGSMAGKRGIDPTVPYWIYLNLHLGTKKPLISKKTGQPVKSPKTGKVVMVPDQKVWSMKNWKTGLVDQHTGTVYLKDVRMHIGQAGRRKVIQTGTKNVHAGVVGMVVKPEEAPVEGWQELHYNPKDHPELAHGFFMLADPRHPDQRISHAKYVRFTPQGTQVWGPTYKKGPHDDDLYLGSEANGSRAQKGVSHILAQVEPMVKIKSLLFLEKSAAHANKHLKPTTK